MSWTGPAWQSLRVEAKMATTLTWRLAANDVVLLHIFSFPPFLRHHIVTYCLIGL